MKILTLMLALFATNAFAGITQEMIDKAAGKVVAKKSLATKTVGLSHLSQNWLQPQVQPLVQPLPACVVLAPVQTVVYSYETVVDAPLVQHSDGLGHSGSHESMAHTSMHSGRGCLFGRLFSRMRSRVAARQHARQSRRAARSSSQMSHGMHH